ncbi:hypothetical protein BAUCODRAFT_150328 [Baudoinia panamericana UAMH 10762]|uniref:Uncharacterized protein n=1 Tax=Baudoinia panamericana (strain UAMH 10762) TaxID=717646 RepID=M2MC83_BAUPA|nr:uncharacterized protein BAUCODRAFT_150328 [Baudoinia panamericana UAMH 10762]EMC94116.1 hypothetical protein BAUCODRAFT_150328 [Baudoinia panamericana UAMH 10762]
MNITGQQMSAQAHQHHQQAWQHHQQVMLHQANVTQSMRQNMQNMMQSVMTPPLPALPVPSPGYQRQASYSQQTSRQQIHYAQSPHAVQQVNAQQIQYTSPQTRPQVGHLQRPPTPHSRVIGEEGSDSEEESDSDDELSDSDHESHRAEIDHDRVDNEQSDRSLRQRLAATEQSMLVMQQTLTAQQQHLQQDWANEREERKARDKREHEERKARDSAITREMEALRRQNAAQLHVHEKQHAKEREERKVQEARGRAELEAKAREADSLRQQLDRHRRLQLEQEQQHGRELASLATQARSPQPQPGVDMSALQKVIDEIRTHKIEKGDIRALIDDVVGKQLKGVARAEDLESATAKMEKTLSEVRPGASASEMKGAVDKGLFEAVERVAKHARKQQRIEQAPPAAGMSRQISPIGPHVEYMVEELEDEPVVSSLKKESKAGPSPAAVRSNDMTSIGGSLKAGSPAVTAPGTQVARVKKSQDPKQTSAIASGALTRSPVPGANQSQTKPSASHHSVHPGGDTTLARISKEPKSPVREPAPRTSSTLAPIPRTEGSSSKNKSWLSAAVPQKDPGSAVLLVKDPEAQVQMEAAPSRAELQSSSAMARYNPSNRGEQDPAVPKNQRRSSNLCIRRHRHQGPSLMVKLW